MTEEAPSADCPSATIGVWNVAYNKNIMENKSIAFIDNIYKLVKINQNIILEECCFSEFLEI